MSWTSPPSETRSKRAACRVCHALRPFSADSSFWKFLFLDFFSFAKKFAPLYGFEIYTEGWRCGQCHFLLLFTWKILLIQNKKKSCNFGALRWTLCAPAR